MMNALKRPALTLLAAIAIVGLTAGFEQAPKSRMPALMNRCTAMFGQFWRYDGVTSGGAYHGVVARAVLAHDRCWRGHYKVSLKELELMLHNDLLPNPVAGAPMPVEFEDAD